MHSVMFMISLRSLSFWCRFVSDDLWNAVVCFQPPVQFAYRKGLGTCDALQSAMESGQEAMIAALIAHLIDFRPAFDIVNHQGILYKLCSVCIGGYVLSILTQFLSNRSQHVMWTLVGVNWLKSCQECLREVFWARYCSSCRPRSFFSIQENKLVADAMTRLW